jgi:heme oxygenase-like protein
MAHSDRLHEIFEETLARFNASPALERVRLRQIGLPHYKAYLRQVFHQTRENPQLQALATVYLRGSQRSVIRRFYGHAASEVGHDQLALNDLAALGEDVVEIPFENPLPQTSAVLAFAFYQVCNLNPVGYLGYLYFLEHTPTTQGASLLEILTSLGVPPQAMTFLDDHVKVDVGHNKLMEGYIEDLVRTEEDLAAVSYAMRTTGELYAAMIGAAFDQADAPRSWGVSPVELQARA